MHDQGSVALMSIQKRGSTILFQQALRKVGDTTNLQRNWKGIFHFHHTGPTWLPHRRLVRPIWIERIGSLQSTPESTARKDGNIGYLTGMTKQQRVVCEMTTKDGYPMIKSFQVATWNQQGLWVADAIVCIVSLIPDRMERFWTSTTPLEQIKSKVWSQRMEIGKMISNQRDMIHTQQVYCQQGISMPLEKRPHTWNQRAVPIIREFEMWSTWEKQTQVSMWKRQQRCMRLATSFLQGPYSTMRRGFENSKRYLRTVLERWKNWSVISLWDQGFQTNSIQLRLQRNYWRISVTSSQ